MELIKNFLNQNYSRRISVFVIGDAMVDEYYSVNVTRVSPEFPIPVMRTETANPSYTLPGGAANVARQFCHFNADVFLCSFLDDYAAEVFKDLNISKSVQINGSVPIKRRLYDNSFPTYRWDVEQPCYGLNDDDIFRSGRNLLYNAGPGCLKKDKADVFIFSDYGKGVFKNNFWHLYDIPVPTIVDPKHGDVKQWQGCTVFKPNRSEAEALSGYKNWKDQCKYFVRNINCQSVVITQGGEGVCGCFREGKSLDFFNYLPEEKKTDPNSVIGAGDCFVSFLTMALAHGFKVPEAARIAFEAGALYVTRHHNRPITPCELLASVDSLAAKFVSSEELSRINNLTVVNGCFDILHSGHLSMLRFAKAQGKKLAVAVNSDESVRRLKGDTRPINKLKDRMDLLASLEIVDYVISFDEDTPVRLLSEIKPDILVKGADYQIYEVLGREYAGEVRLAPLVPGNSTTNILKQV